ncbi:MAG: response regulator [Planctomycetes bacterium]|nr:response regulator [Planctomycetota bacterium]
MSDPAAAPPAPAQRLLVVDDDAASLHVMQGLLEAQGFVVVTSRSGSEALEKVVDADPDLILLDVGMPGLDGYTVCEILKADPRLHWIPVLMLADANYSDVALRCLDAGAHDFIRVPYEAEELFAKVRAAVRTRQRDIAFLENQSRLEAQIATEEDRRKRQTMEATFANLINERPDLESKAALIREHLPHVLGIALFSVFAYDPVSNTLRLTTTNNPRLKNLSGIPLVRGTVMGETVVTGKPVLVENFSASRFSRPSADRPYARNSCVCVPLRIENRVIGVANLHDKLTGEFTPADLIDIGRVCAFMASALENAYRNLHAYHDAVRDRITGCYSRLYVEEHMPRYVKLAKRTQLPLSVIIAAVDGTGSDTRMFDVTRRDVILRNVGTFLQKQLRDTDLLAHYPPEHFLMVLPATPGDHAVAVAERIQDFVAQQEFGPSLAPMRASLSMGIASFPESGWEASSLMEAAARALEKARAGGRSGRAVAPHVVPVRPGAGAPAGAAGGAGAGAAHKPQA